LYSGTTSAAGNNPPTFISFKWTVPKKYKNIATGNPSVDVTFFSKYFDYSTAGAPNTWSNTPKAYLVNEEVTVITGTSFAGYSYTQLIVSTDIYPSVWGYSYAKVAKV
jgi:hypothetical protein